MRDFRTGGSRLHVSVRRFAAAMSLGKVVNNKLRMHIMNSEHLCMHHSLRTYKSASSWLYWAVLKRASVSSWSVRVPMGMGFGKGRDVKIIAEAIDIAAQMWFRCLNCISS